MPITEINENRPSAPTNLAEVSEGSPVAPSAIAEVAEGNVGNPTNLTETAESAPIAPTGLSEIGLSGLGNPSNLTELNQSSPLAPTNLNELVNGLVESPANLAEVSEGNVGNPVNLSEVAQGSISAPASLNELALQTLGNPLNVSEVADAGINRTLQPLFNFNADLGLPDSVTYSRASSATYIETYRDQLGRFQTRLTTDYAGSVTNILTYSQDFDNAAWVGISIVKIKDNKEDAFRLIESNTTSEHRMDQAFTATNNVTFTVLAKALKNNGVIVLRVGNLAGAYFDLASGSIGTIIGSSMPSIRFVGDGYYQCSVFADSPSVNIARVNTAQTPTESLNYTGDGKSGILIKHAQLTQSAKPLPYVRTFNTGVTQTFTANPRYEDKGLLVEGASTNLIISSESIEDGSWGKANITVTANQQLSVDGSLSADAIRVDNGISTSAAFVQRITAKASSPITYTASCYAKADNLNSIRLLAFGVDLLSRMEATFNLTDGAVSGISTVGGFVEIGTSSEYISNGFYRVSISFTTDGHSSISFRIYPVSDAGAVVSNGALGIFLWGAQLEALPFATSYIRTEGAAVSRSRDIVQGSAYTDGFGTVSADFSTLGSSLSNQTPLAIEGASNQDYIWILSAPSNGDSLARSYISKNNLIQTSFVSPVSTINTPITLAITFSDDNALTYINGELVNSDIDAQIPSTSRLSLGASLSAANLLYGHITKAQVYDIELNANEVKSL